jgi:tripartite-type tricarboxylate transporter receptor subunit TctC
MSVAGCMIALALAATGSVAMAQGWAPQKNVEIVAGSALGDTNDKTARMGLAHEPSARMTSAD